MFHLNYLEKLNPMRFDKGELIFEKGQKPKEIFLNLGGLMKNLETGRIFETGQMIG